MPAGALPSGVPSRTPSTLSAHSSTLLIAPDTYRMRNKLIGERPAHHLYCCSCRPWRPRYVDACPLALGLFRKMRTFFDIACRNRANENFSPLPTACDEIPPVSLPRSWFFITPSAVCPVCAATCAAIQTYMSWHAITHFCLSTCTRIHLSMCVCAFVARRPVERRWAAR